MQKTSYAFKKEPDSTRHLVTNLQPRTRLQVLADRAGICLSAICIVHCILTPVILLALPAFQFFEWYHESLHVIFAVIIPLLALAAFVPGYRLHGEKRVFGIAL